MNIIKIVFITTVVMLSSTLLAHTSLESSFPKQDDTLLTSPEKIVLTFKSDVRLMKFELVDQEQNPLKLGFKPIKKKSDRFEIAVPALEASQYKANWMILGADGHKIKGSFAFNVVGAEAANNLPLVTVYKSESCGCCNAWIEHMQNNGFEVQAHNTNDLQPYKRKAKLGPSLSSCHTAFVDGYAIEGHVPAADVKQLLKARPDVSGLTAPGMPMQSPGMAPKGSEPAGYDVLSYKDGEVVGVFKKY